MLIGHSLGATSRCASRRPPARVARLVLVDGGLDVRHEVLESLRPAIDRLGGVPVADVFLSFVRLLPMFEGRWNDYLEGYFRYDVEALPAGRCGRRRRGGHRGGARNLQRERLWALHHQVRCPTLIYARPTVSLRRATAS